MTAFDHGAATPDELDDASLPSTDDAALERLRRFGGGKLLREMIAIFQSVTPTRMASAREGVNSGDVASVEQALHSLKSSAGQLGALRMQRLCERGEREARAGSIASAPAIIRALEAELPHVMTWLDNARNGESS